MNRSPSIALALALSAAASPALATTCAEFVALDPDARNSVVAAFEPPAGELGAPDEAGALESRAMSLLQLCESRPEADVEEVLRAVGR